MTAPSPAPAGTYTTTTPPLMEPWDGPAAILFSDGDVVGAVLDRNGLRPARYYLTDDSRLILSSEVGVLDIPPEHIVEKSRLRPGKMLLADLRQGRIIDDQELKEGLRRPAALWRVAGHQSAPSGRPADPKPAGGAAQPGGT